MMTTRLVYAGLAAMALTFASTAGAEALPGPARQSGDHASMIERVDSYKHRHYRHYHHYDSAGTHVRAPFASVDDDRRGTHVEAPFAGVHTDRYGTWVRAPFVNLFVPH